MEENGAKDGVVKGIKKNMAFIQQMCLHSTGAFLCFNLYSILCSLHLRDGCW